MLSGVSIRSIQRFKTQSLAEKAQPRKERSDKITVDDFDRCIIRRTISDMLVAKKTLPTVKSVLKEIKSEDSIGFKGGKTVLRKTLTEMGFSYRKCSDNRKLLMERTDIVAHRINFLRQMRTGTSFIQTSLTLILAIQLTSAGKPTKLV